MDISIKWQNGSPVELSPITARRVQQEAPTSSCERGGSAPATILNSGHKRGLGSLLHLYTISMKSIDLAQRSKTETIATQLRKGTMLDAL